MKAFTDFLVFVTIWVIIVCGFLYLTRRYAVRVSTNCSLEEPCSDRCGREHQRQHELLSARYSEVARELDKIIQPGQDQEPTQGLFTRRRRITSGVR